SPYTRRAFPLSVEILGPDRRAGPRIPPEVRGRVRGRELRVLDRLPDLTRKLERRREELARHEPSETPEGAEDTGGHAELHPLAPGPPFLRLFVFPAHRGNL